MKYFRENYDTEEKSEIDKILTSEKYADFIEMVYNYHNSKVQKEPSDKTRLCLRCYQDADRTINYFWSQLLRNKPERKTISPLEIF